MHSRLFFTYGVMTKVFLQKNQGQELERGPLRGKLREITTKPVAFTVAPNGLSRPFGRNKAMILELYKELLKPGLKHTNMHHDRNNWDDHHSNRTNWDDLLNF